MTDLKDMKAKNRVHSAEYLAAGGALLGGAAYGNHRLDRALGDRPKIVRAAREGKLAPIHAGRVAGKVGVMAARATAWPMLAYGAYGVLKPNRETKRLSVSNDVVRPLAGNTMLRDKNKMVEDHLSKRDMTRVEQKRLLAHKKAGRLLSLASGTMGITALALRGPGATAALRRTAARMAKRPIPVIAARPRITHASNALGVTAIGTGSIGSFNYAAQQKLESKQAEQQFKKSFVTGVGWRPITNRGMSGLPAMDKNMIDSLRTSARVGRQGGNTHLSQLTGDHSQVDRVTGQVRPGRSRVTREDAKAAEVMSGSMRDNREFTARARLSPGYEVSDRKLHGGRVSVVRRVPGSDAPRIHDIKGSYSAATGGTRRDKGMVHIDADATPGYDEKDILRHEVLGHSNRRHRAKGVYRTYTSPSASMGDEARSVRQQTPASQTNYGAALKPKRQWWGGRNKDKDRARLSNFIQRRHPGATTADADAAMGHYKRVLAKVPQRTNFNTTLPEFRQPGGVKKSDQFIRQYGQNISPKAEEGYNNLRGIRRQHTLLAVGEGTTAGLVGALTAANVRRGGGKLATATGTAGTLLGAASTTYEARAARSANNRLKKIKAKAYERAAVGELGEGRVAKDRVGDMTEASIGAEALMLGVGGNKVFDAARNKATAVVEAKRRRDIAPHTAVLRLDKDGKPIKHPNSKGRSYFGTLPKTSTEKYNAKVDTRRAAGAVAEANRVRNVRVARINRAVGFKPRAVAMGTAMTAGTGLLWHGGRNYVNEPPKKKVIKNLSRRDVDFGTAGAITGAAAYQGALYATKPIDRRIESEIASAPPSVKHVLSEHRRTSGVPKDAPMGDSRWLKYHRTYPKTEIAATYRSPAIPGTKGKRLTVKIPAHAWKRTMSYAQGGKAGVAATAVAAGAAGAGAISLGRRQSKKPVRKSMVRVKGVMTHIPVNELTPAQRKQVATAHMHRQLGRGPSVKERRVEREVGETLRLTRHHIDRGRTAGIFQGGDITRTRQVKGGTVHIADDAFDLNMAPHTASGGFSTASLKPGQSQRQADRAVSITRGRDTKGVEAHEVEGHANRRKKLSWEVRSAMHPEKLLGDEARADSKMSLARRKLSSYNVAAGANNPAMLGTENPDYRRAGRKGLQRYREVSQKIDDAKPKSAPVRAYNAFTQAQPMRSALDFRNRVAEQAQRPARSLVNRFLPERSHQYSKADVAKWGLLRTPKPNYTRPIGALLRTPRPRSGGVRRNAYGTISTFRGSVR